MFIIKPLNNEVASINKLKELLIAYGNYMYEQLNLIAGKYIFYDDLKFLPGIKYSHPLGSWLLAYEQNNLIGCVAIKQYNESKCEMKRMYIYPEYRGKGYGKALCVAAVKTASDLGYTTILLDTNSEMVEAVSLYLSCGFNSIPAYCINENDHPVYMSYEIK